MVIRLKRTAHLYFETSAVFTLILFGKYLEARAKSQTTHALNQLLNLQEARLIKDDGTETMVPLQNVQVGDPYLLNQEKKIPVDAKVIKGTTTVDESMLTGESMPIDKTVDNEVIGATLNKNELSLPFKQQK